MSLFRRLLGVEKRGAPPPDPIYGSSFFQYLLPGPYNINRRTLKDDQLQAYLGWTASAVNLISQEVRQVPWGIARRTETGPELFEDNQIPGLFKNPGRWESYGTFIDLTLKHYDTTGEAFWYLITENDEPGGRVIGMQIMYPHWINEPVYDDTLRMFTAWRVTIPGQVPQIIPMEDLVRIFKPHPREPWRAASPVEQVALSGDFDIYAKAYGVDMLQQGGQPPGILSMEQRLDPKDADLIKERWKNQRKDPGLPLVMGQGGKYEKVGASIDDLRWLDLSRMSRDQILAIYGVPAAMLGLIEDVNRANAEGVTRIFAKNVLRPRLKVLSEAFTSIFDRVEGLDDPSLYFWFDDPVTDDPELVQTKANSALDRGAIKVDEYREALGWEPLENGQGQVFMIPRTSRVADELEPEPLQLVDNRPNEPNARLTFAPTINNLGPVASGNAPESSDSRPGGQSDPVVSGDMTPPLKLGQGEQEPPPVLPPFLLQDLRNLDRDQVISVLKRRGIIPKEVGEYLSDKQLQLRGLQFERVQEPLERSWVERLSALFERQGKAVAKAIRDRKTQPKLRVRAELTYDLVGDHWEKQKRIAHEETGPLRLLYDLRQDDDEPRDLLDRVFDRQRRSWQRTLTALNFRGQRDGWELLVDEVDRALLAFDTAAPDILRDVTAQADDLLDEINNTTRRTVASAVAKVLADNSNATNEEIAKEVERVYRGFVDGTFPGSHTRTDTIGRTESSAAINRGKARHMVLSEQELDVRFVNTWNTVLDGRQRDAHNQAHGQRRDLDESFDVGGEKLRYPLDPNGSAENIINCRCTTATEIVEDD